MLWEIFQIAPIVPRADLGYHLAMVIKEGPTPKPWKKPFKTMRMRNIVKLSAKPMSKFMRAHMIRPKTINFLGLHLSEIEDITPFEIP